MFSEDSFLKVLVVALALFAGYLAFFKLGYQPAPQPPIPVEVPEEPKKPEKPRCPRCPRCPNSQPDCPNCPNCPYSAQK